MNLILEYDDNTSFLVSPVGDGDLIAWIDEYSDLVVWADSRNSSLLEIPGSLFVPYYEVI